MSTSECQYAHSDMTPCVAKDGDIARADDGVCVGCGRAQPEPRTPDETLAAQVEALLADDECILTPDSEIAPGVWEGGAREHTGCRYCTISDAAKRLRELAGEKRDAESAMRSVIHELRHGLASEGDLSELRWCARMLECAIARAAQPTEGSDA